MSNKYCDWNEKENGEYFQPSCGADPFTFEHDPVGYLGRKFVYCPFCGEKIRVYWEISHL